MTLVGPWSSNDSDLQDALDAIAAIIQMKRTDMQIAAVDLLNAKAGPPTVLAAVDDSIMAQELFAVISYQHVSTDYTLGDATQFYIGPRSSPKTNYCLQPFGTNLVDGTFTPPVIAKVPAVNPLVNSQSFFPSEDLVLTHNGSGELSGGDGILTVRLFYTLVELD
jgi:hypothetical protein